MSNIVNISDVFISYSRKNTEFARKLFEEFKKRDMEVWADWEDIPKGAQWRAEINAGVQGADAFLFVISPDSVKSEECRKEIELAIQYKKRIVPVLYVDLEKSDFDLMHPAIGAHNWIFSREEDPWDKAFKTILDTIHTDLEHVREHTRLNVRAQEWINNQRNESFLLDGTELVAAEKWLESSEGKEPEPTETHELYISMSRKSVMRRRSILIGGTVVTLIILALGILSFVLYRQSEYNLAQSQERAREARSLSQAASSEVVLSNEDDDLALSLAVEAAKYFETGETEFALANAAYVLGGQRNVIQAHEDIINGVDYAPDGSMVVSAGDDGAIRLWDAETGELIKELTYHEAEVKDVVFSNDGSMLLSGSTDGKMVMWDTATWEILHTYITPPEVHVQAVDINRAMTQVVAATNEGVFLWDIDSEDAPKSVHQSEEAHFLSVAFSTNGRWLAAGTEKGDIDFWSVRNWEEQQTLIGHKGEVHDLAFSPDGKYLVSVSEDSTIRKWSTETGEYIDDIGSTGSLPYEAGRHTDGVLSVDFSNDGKNLLTSSWGLKAIYWNFETGYTIDQLADNSDSVMDVAFSPDGTRGVTGTYDGKVAIWNLTFGAESLRLSNDTFSIDVDYSNDGYYVISNGDMALRDVQTGDVVHEYWDNEGKRCNIKATADIAGATACSVEFSYNDQWVAGGFEDGSVRLWNRESGDLLYTWTENTDVVIDLAFSPDSSKLFSASGDGYIKIWDTATGELINSIEKPSDQTASEDHPNADAIEKGNRFTSIAISPNGQLLAAGSFDLNAYIWDIQSGELLHTLTGNRDWVNDVSFSPDNTMLVTGAYDWSIRIWDVNQGTQVRKIDGHLGPVVSVAFGPRGKTIMSAGWDNVIQIWDIESSLKLRRFEGHTDLVNDVEFSPDGKMVVSGGLDGTLRLWYVHNLDELNEWIAENRYVAPFSCDERAIYRVLPLCEDAELPASEQSN